MRRSSERNFAAALGSATTIRDRVTKSAIVSLLLPFLIFVLGGQAITAPSANAVVANCTDSQFLIEAKHNPTFYFDNGTPITSNYLQFKITNKTNSSTTGYYAEIDNFSASPSPKIGIATYENAAQPFLKTLATNEYVNLYWYLTASGTTTNTTTFDVTIYDGNPSGAGAAVCKLNKSITEVDSTISANANKLTSVIYSSLPTANSDGSATFTATVKGQTGTIGAGPTGARDVNLSPATTSTFNAKKFRLSGTSYRCGTGVAVVDQLFISNACSGAYTAVFTYQYLTPDTTAGASETLSPIMQIASGTQMKHTSTPSFTIATIGSVPSNTVTTLAATNLFSSSATVNGTNDYGTYTTLYFCYSATNPGAAFGDNCTNKANAIETSAGSGAYYANLTGLTNNTTYYFELTGENGSPIVYTRGGVLSFLAKAYATTTSPTSIGSTTATLNGSQSGLTAANVDTTNTFFYYTTTNPGSAHVSQSDTQTVASALSASNDSFSSNLTGLTSGTTYYYEIVVKDIDAVTYVGGVQNFTTTGGAAINYKVTFDVNGGSGTPSVSDVTQGSSGASVNLATVGTLTREGFVFSGWNESDDGTSTNYDEGSAYTPTSDITLYAKWVPNKYRYNANTGTGGPTDQEYAGATLQAISNSFTAPSGYEFDGWCTAQLSVGTISCSGGNTKYSPSTNLPTPTSSIVTLYAIWKLTPAAPPPPPVYVPRPPTITNISAPEVCAVGSQLTLTGTYLLGASVTVDGIAAQVLSSSNASMLISLPARSTGTKTIVVTNVDGSASTTVKYKFVDSPVYVNFIYPETFKDSEFSYTFKATDAERYSIIGTLPAGLTLNPLTGEISGTPTVEGDYLFTIVASNFCDQTYLNVYMFVDRALPAAFTCSVAFNVPRSDNISDIKLSQLKTCLDKIKTLSPKYIEPIIYLSGGLPAGLTPQQALVHPRYIRIIDFIKSIGLDYQFYVGAFGGTAESVQINVYWPTT